MMLVNKQFQQGLLLLTFVFLVLMLSITIFFMVGWHRKENELPKTDAEVLLEEVKFNLLFHSSAESSTFAYITHMPDVPESAETPPNNYNGYSQSGCIHLNPSANWSNLNTWGIAATQATVDISTAGASSRCFGRFPWRTYGMKTLIQKDADENGLVPWFAMSSNLGLTALCLPHRTPLILGASFNPPGFCPSIGTLPLRWLSVKNDRGIVESTEVAFVLMLPGVPHSGQNRNATMGPNQYLDNFAYLTDSSTTTRSNANAFAVPNTQNQTYYLTRPVSTLFDRGSSTYRQPYSVNDHVIYMSAEQYFYYHERIAVRRLEYALQRYAERTGHLPYAAPLGGNIYGAYPTQQSGLRLGWVPYDELREVLDPPLTSPWYPSTQTDKDLFKGINQLATSGWFHYFIYAVSNSCATGPLNGCGSITVGSANTIQAILIGPGRSLGSPAIAMNGALAATASAYMEGLNSDATPDVFEADTRARTTNYNDYVFIIKVP